MNFAVFCTFDLKGASADTYRNIYDDLAGIGLFKIHETDQGGSAVIPTTSVMGSFDANSADGLRDATMGAVRQIMTARGVRSEIFILVGGPNWTWYAHST